MRFPSLFRTPRHQQFHIEPRYYDPIKEEIEERTERIRKELHGEYEGGTAGRISFKRKKAKKAPSSSLLQLGIAVLLIGLTFGWLELGNDVFYYALYLALPLYLFFRIKKMRSNR